MEAFHKTIVIPADAGIHRLDLAVMRDSFQPCVYLLANRKQGAIYVGVTSNLMQRLCQHREDVHEGFTNRHAVKRLVWFEQHATMETAIRREKQIKKWRRAWKIDLIEQGNADWRDLAADLGFEVHRAKFETTHLRHPREGGGPSDE